LRPVLALQTSISTPSGRLHAKQTSAHVWVVHTQQRRCAKRNPGPLADGWRGLFVGVRCRPTSYPDRSLGSITILGARGRTPDQSKLLSMRPDAKSLYNVVCLREASRRAYECSRHALTIQTPTRRFLLSWTSRASQACGQKSGLLDDTSGGDQSAHTSRRTSEPHTARAPTLRHDTPHHRGLHHRRDTILDALTSRWSAQT